MKIASKSEAGIGLSFVIVVAVGTMWEQGLPGNRFGSRVDPPRHIDDLTCLKSKLHLLSVGFLLLKEEESAVIDVFSAGALVRCSFSFLQ